MGESELDELAASLASKFSASLSLDFADPVASPEGPSAASRNREPAVEQEPPPVPVGAAEIARTSLPATTDAPPLQQPLPSPPPRMSTHPLECLSDDGGAGLVVMPSGFTSGSDDSDSGDELLGMWAPQPQRQQHAPAAPAPAADTAATTSASSLAIQPGGVWEDWAYGFGRADNTPNATEGAAEESATVAPSRVDAPPSDACHSTAPPISGASLAAAVDRQPVERPRTPIARASAPPATHLALSPADFQDWAFGFGSTGATTRSPQPPQRIAPTDSSNAVQGAVPTPDAPAEVGAEAAGGRGAAAAAAAAAHFGMSPDAYREWLFGNGAPPPATAAPPQRAPAQPPATRVSDSTAAAPADFPVDGRHNDGDDEILAGLADALTARKHAAAQEQQSALGGGDCVDRLTLGVAAMESAQSEKAPEAAADIRLERTELATSTAGASTPTHRFGNVLRGAALDDTPLEFSDAPSASASKPVPARQPPGPPETEWAPPAAAAAGTVYYAVEGEGTFTSSSGNSGTTRVRISSDVAFTAPPHSHTHWAPTPASTEGGPTTAGSSGTTGTTGAARLAASGRKYDDAEAARIARIMGRRGA
eukprot:jgi/Tetstr1/426168/TSEL_016493.t1